LRRDIYLGAAEAFGAATEYLAGLAQSEVTRAHGAKLVENLSRVTAKMEQKNVTVISRARSFGCPFVVSDNATKLLTKRKSYSVSRLQIRFGHGFFNGIRSIWRGPSVDFQKRISRCSGGLRRFLNEPRL